MRDNDNVIEAINIGGEEYRIAADYLGGYDFDDIESFLHGAVDTYVIHSDKQEKECYENIVHNKYSTFEVDKEILKTLIDGNETFKVGDIILMEEESVDGDKVFDRWVSNVSGDIVNLSVLETQVAKHYHTVETSRGSAITNVSFIPDVNLAQVGSSVSVVYSASGSVLTSVKYDDECATTSLSVTTDMSGSKDSSHIHNIPEQTITLHPSEFIGATISAYTSLSTTTLTTHSHDTDVSVATPAISVSSIKCIANYDSGKFITSLTKFTSDTGGTLLSTGSNVNGLTTSEMSTTVSVGDLVKTTESGSHTHTATVTTGSCVITSVSIPPEVVTSVDYSGGKIQKNVVTSLSTNDVTVVTSWREASKSSFLTIPSVNEGVLSFLTGEAVTSANTILSSKKVKVVNSISSAEQFTPTLSYTTVSQAAYNNSVELSVKVVNGGSHKHGFSHTHVIPSHTHVIPSHTHTYVSVSVSDMDYALTSLTTYSYTPHTHSSTVSVAGVCEDSGKINYVYGGVTSNAISELMNLSSVTLSSLSTYETCLSVVGEILLPELLSTTISLSTMLSTTEIKPAQSGGTGVIKVTTGSFITNIIDDRTGVNKGGE